MAIHWTIPFKSLRAGTQYTVRIYDAAYSGDPIPLKGGDDPFVTQEDADTDEFMPVRTQTGYLRIVDDGKDANGGTFNWKALLPKTDTDRPVTLVNGSGTVVWQGFMQAQTFSGELYGYTQEREFPVQCPLAVLSATQVSTTETQLHNFAYLLKYIATTPPSPASFSNFVIQGGADARKWLLKMFDWMNFLTESNTGVTARYTAMDVLEDMCRYWGWTARSVGTTLYLTCADDTAEQTFLTLTAAQLSTLAGGSSAGDTGNWLGTVDLDSIDDIFASTDNDDIIVRGPNKATVKADVNEENTVMQFAPTAVRDAIGDSFSWVQGDGDMVGYFTTPTLNSFHTDTLDGNSTAPYGGFARRVIYSTTESDKGVNADVILVHHVYDGSTAYSSIQTKRAMAYSGGSLSIGGTIFVGATQYPNSASMLKMRLGIGMTRATAKWWYMAPFITGTGGNIPHYWSDELASFSAVVEGGSIKGTGLNIFVFNKYLSYPRIPVDEGLYGYIFVDFLGMIWGDTDVTEFEIANFEIGFTRDATDIPTSASVVRPRTLETERVSSKEYTSDNANQAREQWNADCIFASDNNMEYGYGLLMNADGTYMETADYGSSAEHPEQHLADRVTTFWAQNKRAMTVELLSDLLPEVNPRHRVQLDSVTCHPIAISHNWRDDVTALSLLEL